MRLPKILFLLVFSVSLVFAGGGDNTQPVAKDMSQKATKFDNPYLVAGAPYQLESSTLSESFESTTFPPAGWTKLSPDGGTGWTRIATGTTPLPGWNGGTATPATGTAGTGMAYATWNTGGATANDQWLVTPQITSVGANHSLSFWMRKFGAYAEAFDVKISTTTGTATASFTINALTKTYLAADSGWAQYTVPIGTLVPAGSNIYIAFREYVADNFNDGAALLLDLVEVTGDVVPVEFTSFTGSVSGNTVKLNWATASETNNKGFEIQKSLNNGDFVTVAFVTGKGTTTEAQSYTYVEKDVVDGNYLYRLKQVDFDGKVSYSNGIEVDVTTPAVFALDQNYPNPFNPSTTINFGLAVDSKVSLKIFNVLGQEVASLANGLMSAGKHTVTFNGSSLFSGVYFAKMEAKGVDGSSFTSFKKMILNK
ncbi:MAG: choice-of-anchor J domain-containing protein [Ignavibacteriaceae bacterium]|nr:choice-of-anchor J domain-containing protein [Ignavibacteriaceae bacterium]